MKRFILKQSDVVVFSILFTILCGAALIIGSCAPEPQPTQAEIQAEIHTAGTVYINDVLYACEVVEF